MNLVSSKTRKVARKYYPENSEEVISQLQEYCDYLSEFLSESNRPENYERFLLAILKIGKSSQSKLNQAIKLGKIDYRDLLVNAGFGNSLTAHEEWVKKVLKKKNITSALSGRASPSPANF